MKLTPGPPGRPLLCVHFLWAALCTGAAAGPPAPGASAGAAARAPHPRPSLAVTRAAGRITIDGDLHDPGWRGAARATGFTEFAPHEGARPPVRSEAWLTYDEHALYVALIAHDDPAAVRVSWCDRDAIFRDDYFGIMLDTHGDFTWAYELFVNPLGIQGDLRADGDGAEDLNFDLVWESRGRLTERGYQVEVAIPFASLRFPQREEQRWRINFWRDHQREVRRQYSWAAIDRDIQCWMCQWGTLTGLRGIHGGPALELIAGALGHRTAARADPSVPPSREAAAQLSLNARYGFSTSASAEISINPDFSQIESDAPQIDVNTTYALFYPESRPFFQEGSDLYRTPIDIVHTRSINAPRLAGKFTGTFGRWALLYLVARDGDTPFLLPGAERSFQPLEWNGIRGLRSLSNLLRVRRSLPPDGYLGVTITDRRIQEAGGGSGSVLGLDGRARLGRRCRISFQGVASRTAEPRDSLLTRGLADLTFAGGRRTYVFDGERFWGHALHVALEREGRRWNGRVTYRETSPTFRAENGFLRANDERRLSLEGDLRFYPNRALLVGWTPRMELGRAWSHAGRLREEWIDGGIQVSLVGQTSLSLSGSMRGERFGGRRFGSMPAVALAWDGSPSEALAGGAYVESGRTILRQAADPRRVGFTSAGAYATCKPLARLVLSPELSYYQLGDRGQRISSGTLARARIDLQLSRACAARAIVQYDAFTRTFGAEPLLSYRVNPFTVFYLGAVTRATAAEHWVATDRQLFAKIQGLLRL